MTENGAAVGALADMGDRNLLSYGAGAAAAYGLYKLADQRLYLSSDLKQLWKLAQVKLAVDANVRNDVTAADLFETVAAKDPARPMFVFEGRDVSFGEVDRQSNRLARWMQAVGLGRGDVVALFMENRPEFVVTWLAVAKIGGVTALINHNLRTKALQHSVQVVQETLQRGGRKLYSFGGRVPFCGCLDTAIASVEDAPIPRAARRGVGAMDKALLVYTSGTTGLPKAATITHLRFFSMAKLFVTVFEVRPEDRIYCVLPLYHSAGGLCGVGMVMLTGATMVLRRKFSASAFWPDVRAHRCTVVQYIGELCRYLLNCPPHPDDGHNQVRIAVGNGLRPDIWADFQRRFRIKEIGEFYGSTEGNAALFNHCTTADARGSVGHYGPLMKQVVRFRIVKFDVVTEQPVRGEDGLCVECADGEPGELLGEIVDGDPIRQFAGYHGNKQATEKKILRDVLRRGDKYFRTGDLLRRDASGYVYFVDRIGDTFRWKGENVSTTEVAEVVSVFPGVAEANVYGVQVPAHDGRACMVALVLEEGCRDVDLRAFAAHCEEHLPPYARPVFLRVLPKMDVTGTFKHQKVQLRKEGIDPSVVSDPLYVADPRAGGYERWTQEAFDELVVSKTSRL